VLQGQEMCSPLKRVRKRNKTKDIFGKIIIIIETVEYEQQLCNVKKEKLGAGIAQWYNAGLWAG
jgi:sensor domain CHASE-containing protein